MTQISQLVANNPQSAWDRVSRRQCFRGAKRLGIKVDAGAKHSEMVGIFVGQGITPEQIVNFVPVVKKTPQGDKIEMYPESKERVYSERKEHHRMEEFEKRIQEGVDADKKEKEAQNVDISALKTDIDELKTMFNQVLASLKDQKPKEDLPVDLKTIHWKRFQKMAKDIGETWTTKDPREPIIERLENG
jgi:hypothetical protein